MRIIALAISLLVLPCFVWAQDRHPIDVSMGKCIEQDDSTVGMRNCINKAADLWDKELNKNYSILMKKLSPEAKKALKSAQLSWIKYRDSEFKVISEIIGKKEGTMWLPIYDEHRKDLVKTRALQLKSYLDSLESD